MSKQFTIMALAAIAALSGCSLIPDYQRPAAPVPVAYPAAYLDEASAQQQATPIAWRDYFTAPQLQQLIDIALSNNRDLIVAALNLERAQSQLQIQGSALFPSIGVGASAARGHNQSTGDLSNTFMAGLVMSAWELDFFGRIRSLREQALAQYLASDEGRKAFELSLVTSVAQSWLTLIADEELLDISRRTLATREQSLKLAQLRLDTGAASELTTVKPNRWQKQLEPHMPSSNVSVHWTKMHWRCCLDSNCQLKSVPISRVAPLPMPQS